MSPNNNQKQATNHQIAELRSQAKAGDRKAMVKLRELLPGRRETIRNLGGDLCRNAEDFHANTVSCAKLDMTAAVGAQLDTLRADLLCEGDSPLERLLIDRVVTCWLTLHTLEQEAGIQYARKPTAAPKLDKAIDRAHRRYLMAIEALARVRKVNYSLAIHLNVTAGSGNDTGTPSAPAEGEIIDL